MIIRSHPLTGDGGCYVICNCNTANMDVVALYLSEQLNNNFILYTREINFSVHIYIFCPPFFSHSQKKTSLNATTIEKKANSLIVKFFHFDERSKSSQRILLVFGSLLLFFPSYELYKIVRISVICCSSRACSECAMIRPRQHDLAVLASSTLILNSLVFIYAIFSGLKVHISRTCPKLMERKLWRRPLPLL